MDSSGRIMWSFRRDPSVVKMLAKLYGRPQEDTAVPVLLDTPKCATQLVALTGQALGSMDRHLRVLLDTGLVQRRRDHTWADDPPSRSRDNAEGAVLSFGESAGPR